MKKVSNPYVKGMKEFNRLKNSQMSKIFNYSLNDFEIEPLVEGSIKFKWKHKNWKTWVIGDYGISNTKSIINRYIDECKKPYGCRNLNFIHITND